MNHTWISGHLASLLSLMSESCSCFPLISSTLHSCYFACHTKHTRFLQVSRGSRYMLPQYNRVHCKSAIHSPSCHSKVILGTRNNHTRWPVGRSLVTVVWISTFGFRIFTMHSATGRDYYIGGGLSCDATIMFQRRWGTSHSSTLHCMFRAMYKASNGSGSGYIECL